MGPELFMDPSAPTLDSADVGGASAPDAQVAAQETPAGQAAAAPGPGADAPDAASAAIEEALRDAQTEPKPEAEAEEHDAGTVEGEPAELPYDVLVEAGAAGLKPEDVRALGTAEAIRAAIKLIGGRAAAPESPTGTAPAATQGQGEPVAPPELKPWELDVPKEFEDADRYDPDLVKHLKSMMGQLRERDEAYRARIDFLEKHSPQGAPVDQSAALMFDMTLNQRLAEEANKPYAEKLGVGWQSELSEEEYTNRQKVATVAAQLHQRQREQGRVPKLGDVLMQAAGIVFPEIASKLGQKAIAARVAARPKVGRPSGGQDNSDPYKRVIQEIAEIQRNSGVR